MGKLIVISGPSGVGKGTIILELMNIYKEKGKKIYLSVSDTTREPREGEIDHVHYNFIKTEEFKDKIKQGNYIESNDYTGNSKLYGTPLIPVKEHLESGYDVILDIDINGYKQVIEKYPQTIGIFIKADLDTLKKRLEKRGTELPQNIKSRLETAKKEIEESNIYPHIIVNKDNEVQKTAIDIYNIIENSN